MLELTPELMPRRRFLIEVVTTTGRAAGIEFRHHHDHVEIWHHGTKVATIDRAQLHTWLQQPSTPLGPDAATLTLDRTVDNTGRIAITLPVVNAWTLSPSEHEHLHSYVAQP